MTDMEFLERLRRELTASLTWSDVRGVVGPADDPGLAGNELLVFPLAAESEADRVSRFRVLVEWEVGPDRPFPEQRRFANVRPYEWEFDPERRRFDQTVTEPHALDPHDDGVLSLLPANFPTEVVDEHGKPQVPLRRIRGGCLLGNSRMRVRWIVLVGTLTGLLKIWMRTLCDSSSTGPPELRCHG